MAAFGLTLSPSPLRVFDRALDVLRRDAGRPLLSLTVFFLLPYLAGFFLVYKGLVDGSRPYEGGYDSGYMVRYYGFIAWYFLLRGLNLVTTGRLIHAGLKGEELSFVQTAREAPALLLRALPVYMPLAVLAYLGQYSGIVPGLVVAFVAAFLLPGYVFERMKLRDALRHAATVLQGRIVILSLGFLLLFGAVTLIERGISWFNAYAAASLSFSAASVLLCFVYALSELMQTAVRLSLYACARDAAAPPEDTAKVFE